MSISSASVATPTRIQFARRVHGVRPSKADINAVIMDYLLSEGYPDAASKFSKEANIEPQLGIQTIDDRVAIRNFIMAGEVESAIERINDFNPQILDLDPQLHFSLLRLQLIETIRRGDPNSKEDLMKAITFANKQLAPRAKGRKEFIEDLEYGMALLIFPRNSLPPQLRKLMEPSLRSQIATQVNETILQSEGRKREASIKQLIKLRQWAEQKCREMKKPIPSRLTLGLTAEEEDEDGDDTLNGNVDGDAIMT